ncbi:predicted protein [Sclerotinia sclerotiorum 1980 UF-70]|uniref:Uncharacterized protein n=1 Tax=Sclerotinia sclerotiorum (strain ATCC 18683 / 1980 / Ss-1) TaxID=665079 RepID=A7F2X7_SCLS1|nr:predicted protein [Sclerotinia sclerotiorum 1980 UF-70]EDN96069.1 predicted protein [Sclerotinia sclerotiorum 1980 UF-70]
MCGGAGLPKRLDVSSSVRKELSRVSHTSRKFVPTYHLTKARPKAVTPAVRYENDY